MDNVLNVLQVVTPIIFAVVLGICARKRKILTGSEIEGLQRFVIKMCIPCLIFNSCLTADITGESLATMAMLPPYQLIGLLWAYRVGKKRFPYHNLPFLFVCKETGMVGIPLFMILFGADQAYRMGILDIAQAMIGFTVIGILTAQPGADTSPRTIVKQLITSPLIILGVLGITLNLTGIWGAVEDIGVGAVVLETLSFLTQPISAVMLFCVGYNFTLDRNCRTEVFRLTAVHVAFFTVVGVIIQGILMLIPGIDPLTRWAAALYFLMPASYLAPGLGRSQKDYTVASGVSSLTTALTLVVFCAIAAVIA